MNENNTLSYDPCSQALVPGLMHIVWAVGQEPGPYSDQSLDLRDLYQDPDKTSPFVPEYFKEDELKYHGRVNRGFKEMKLM